MTRTEQRQQLILVLRVDADAVSHPVMVSGKVLFRIPGHSVPADRHRVLDLVARDQATRNAERGKMNVLRPPWHPTEMGIWPDDKDPHPRAGALRVIGGLELPRRILNRPWLDSAARQAALDALNNSPSGRVPSGSCARGTPKKPEPPISGSSLGRSRRAPTASRARPIRQLTAGYGCWSASDGWVQASRMP
jgi:hypothetical protein